MSDTRNIRPKPFNTPTAGADQSAYHHNTVTLTTTQKKVSVACRICQAKRTKCDGARPECGACKTRQTECGYQTRAGQSHSQARKQKMQELENDKSAMLDILYHLQTTDFEAASELLHQLRSAKSGDVEAMLSCIGRGRPNRSARALSDSFEMDVDEPDEPARKLSSATTLADYHQSPFSPRSQDIIVSLSLFTAPTGHDVSTNEMHVLLDTFFTSVGSLSSIFDRSEVNRSIANLTTDPSLTFVEFCNKPATSSEVTMGLSRVAGMLAIGMMYLRAKTPEAAPSMEVAMFYYSIAKHGLDNAIQQSPLCAMKLCALLAFYNLSMHSGVASAYIGLGVTLARDNGVETDRCSPDGSPEPTGQRQTLRALVYLQCWLSASMDFVPDSVIPSLKLLADRKVDRDESPSLDALHHHVVKITLIKRDILHGPTANVPEPTVAEHRKKLNAYYQDLPPWMNLGQLHPDMESGTPKELRGSVLYVHLFYMSTMMALSRRLIVAHVPKEPLAGGTLRIARESRQAIEEGFMAAQMTVRVLDLILPEGSAVDACWLCIHRFTAYTACIMMAYSAAQKALSGRAASENLDLIARCVRILTCCAQKDELSRALLTSLSPFTSTLQSHKQRWPSDAEEAHVSLIDVLFTIYPGTTDLHLLATALRSLMQRTFGISHERSLPATEIGGMT